MHWFGNDRSLLIMQSCNAGTHDIAVNLSGTTERIKPDQYTRLNGYYVGVAGIAASLLELYVFETGQQGWRRLADDPFPERF